MKNTVLTSMLLTFCLGLVSPSVFAHYMDGEIAQVRADLRATTTALKPIDDKMAILAVAVTEAKEGVRNAKTRVEGERYLRCDDACLTLFNKYRRLKVELAYLERQKASLEINKALYEKALVNLKRQRAGAEREQRHKP